MKAQILVDIYKRQGKHALAEAVADLDATVKSFTNKIAHIWAMDTHTCPVCRKSVTDPYEWEFMADIGECLGCDHVRGCTRNDEL